MGGKNLLDSTWRLYRYEKIFVERRNSRSTILTTRNHKISFFADEALAEIEWFKWNIGLFEEVLRKWSATFNSRQETCKNKTISKKFEHFVALREEHIEYLLVKVILRSMIIVT